MAKTLQTGAELPATTDHGLAAIGAVPGPHPRAATKSMPAAARIVLRMLERLHSGSLTMTLPDGRTLRFGRGEPSAAMRVTRWDVFGTTLARGDIGFAESWIDGGWDTDALADLLGVLIANRDALESAVYGTAAGRLLYRIRHLFRRNSRAGSRRNIHAHYDLGNDFYRLWLDAGMTYSSALFEGGAGRTLEQAQQAKYRRILDELALPAGAAVLEIGCGWGAFAELAVADGLRVKGLTLSTEQLAWARARLAAAEAAGLASFELQDYRDERGRHDGVVSIEMFEAVGEAYWPAYFDTVKRSLKAGGRAVVQTILIDDALFDRYRTGSDFIQQYVFPGGMLPSARRFTEAAARAGLAVTAAEHFGPDYAETLKRWRIAFHAEADAVRKLGFDERFMRIWHFYLAYCEAGFHAGSIDVAQFRLEHAA